MTKILIDEATVKLVLEALEHCKDVIVERGLNGNPEFAERWGLTLPLDRSKEAITALKALAEQPAQQEPVAWKLVPKEPTHEMLKAMDECSTEGYDERLYAGHASSVYMAAVDAAPTPPAQQEPVALDVTIEGEEARALYDLLGDDREDLSPIRLIVGGGHSGYGLYAALAEYQDEGAELIASMPSPASKPLHIGEETAAFKAWFDAWWIGDGEQGETIPTQSDKHFLTYLDQYTLGFGAWMAAKHAAHGIKENT